MDYKETIELENNIKIKNRAIQIYSDFIDNVSLDVETYKDGRFRVWSDPHNAEYIRINGNDFVFECRFLHETYNVEVTPERLFSYIKDNYRGLDHLESFINGRKKLNA